ncbi:MAG: hypothetical protein JO041_03725 [Acidobacteria bacterium]|nr:hypothetical protein [Acidobacteriota bacterium]
MAANTLMRASVCLLCGSSEGSAGDSLERTRKLALQMRALENGASVRELAGNVNHMCDSCRLLMVGMASDDDRLELCARMAKELEPAIEPGARNSRRRDPEDRLTATEHETRQKTLDKTLADSFPTSDPPSTIPDPSSDDLAA